MSLRVLSPFLLTSFIVLGDDMLMALAGMTQICAYGMGISLEFLTHVSNSLLET